MAEHRSSIEIDASPETVFDYLVTDDGLTAWMGEWARVDAVPGGDFSVTIAGYRAKGTYLEVDRPHRVLVTWGFEGIDELPPGTSTVSFDLTAIASGTRLEVLHTDLPEDAVSGHVEGWAHFLPRLAIAGSGGDAGADAWHPRP